MSEIQIRFAKKIDVISIHEFIRDLAIYENEPEAVTNTVEQLSKDLFENKVCEALVAVANEKLVGFSLFYTSYSTWKGACLYLEDLFVLGEYRRSGVGTLLFDELVSICKKRGYKRMDWQVLDWNEPAINFYKKYSAVLDSEWVNGRLFFE